MEKIKRSVKFEGADENRGRIYCRLLNPDYFGEKLDNMPHEKYLDMAVVYYMRMTITKDNYITILVNNEHLKSWGIDEKEVSKIAWENTLRDFPPMMKKLGELLGELGIEVEDKTEGVYIVSNETRELGALTLLYPGQMKKISDVLKSEFYVIPSSVHECLIVKYDENIEAGFLRNTLVTVNRDELERKDVLSNNVYRYIRSRDRLVIDNS